MARKSLEAHQHLPSGWHANRHLIGRTLRSGSAAVASHLHFGGGGGSSKCVSSSSSSSSSSSDSATHERRVHEYALVLRAGTDEQLAGAAAAAVRLEEEGLAVASILSRVGGSADWLEALEHAAELPGAGSRLVDGLVDGLAGMAGAVEDAACAGARSVSRAASRTSTTLEALPIATPPQGPPQASSSSSSSSSSAAAAADRGGERVLVLLLHAARGRLLAQANTIRMDTWMRSATFEEPTLLTEQSFRPSGTYLSTCLLTD